MLDKIASEGGEGRERRVLVIEDDRDFAESLADMLEPLEYQVRLAWDERSALEALGDFEADLAFVDVRLGRANGIELVEAMRTREPNLLCVMMTAYASVETAVEALHAGAYDYLSKPFHPDELFALLRRAYERIDLHERRVQAERALLESEERFRNLIEGSIQGVFVHREWKPLYVNQAFATMLGYDSVEDVMELGNISLIVAPGERDRLRAFEAARKSGAFAPSSYEYQAQRKSGEPLVLQNLVRSVPWWDGEAVQATVVDITERKHAEHELRRSREQFRDFAEASADWFWETDANLRFTYLTGASQEQAGQTPVELEGLTLEEVFAKRIKDSEVWARVVNDVNAHQPLGEFEIQWSEDSDNPRVLRITGKPVFDEEDGFRGYRGTGRDVTEAHVLSEELSYQATHDALTGLVNRRDFERRLQRVIDTTRNQASEHALCYMDLDQFKVINDTCGHQAGDELLRQLAGILADLIRKRDTLARLGGDEFGVLMEHCSLQQAERVANAVRECIEGFRFMWEDKSFTLGVSIGLVPIDRASDSIANVLSNADTACYTAKDQGRNRIHIYRHDDEELHRRYGEMQWVTEINQALEDNRLLMYCQTIVPVHGAPTGDHYELLLRMEDRRGEIIPPGAFLPAADRYNLSVRIDRWVISNALKWLRGNPRHLDELYLCGINVSGSSLGNEDFLAYVARELDSSGVPPSKICFEVTETAAISNLSNATGFIRTLNGLGCKFALDDFGSGLSSFAYLKNLPVDFIKIDGMFVKDIVDDPIDLAMVRSIAEIGQVMGKNTVAEFVENDAILAKLREIGVDFAQGYGIGKPIPLSQYLNQSKSA